MINLQSLCQKASVVTKHAGAFIKEQLGEVQATSIETKSLNSLVSYVDQEAEKMLVKGLHEILPEAVFLTEEETIETSEGEFRWIIDPLDGTTNFLHQVPFFCVSVALQWNDEIVLGIVYEPLREECFTAYKSGGAFLNDYPMSTSASAALADSLLATGFPYYEYERLDGYLAVLKYFIEHIRGLRRAGSAALDMAYVACGRYDGFYEYSLNPWDVAAGVILVKEAGGFVSDFSGGDNYLFGKEMIATNAHLSDEIVAVVNERMVQSGDVKAD